MEIVWDEPKRLANIDKHGFDFKHLDAAFFAAARVEHARTGRFKAIGRHGNDVIAVIFRPLGREALAVISMRSAGPSERRRLG